MIDNDVMPIGFPNASIWQCPLGGIHTSNHPSIIIMHAYHVHVAGLNDAIGSPWQWRVHYRGGCTSCSEGTYDSRLKIIIMTSNSHDAHDDKEDEEEHQADDAGSCLVCDTHMTCSYGVGANLTVPNGWTASIIRSSTTSSGQIIAVLPPPGFGCDNDKECLWFESCTSGRNVSVPFCGACITGTLIYIHTSIDIVIFFVWPL
jgi:hypothetical protein